MNLIKHIVSILFWGNPCYLYLDESDDEMAAAPAVPKTAAVKQAKQDEVQRDIHVHVMCMCSSVSYSDSVNCSISSLSLENQMMTV